MRMPTVCYALNQASLLALLLEAKVYTMNEALPVLNQGFNVSFVPQMPGAEWAAAAVEAPSDEAYTLIDQTFKDNINIANSPVKIKFLGQPDVEPVPSDLQFRLALSEFNIREAVEGYVAQGDQSLKDWYDRTPIFEKNDPRIVQAIADMKMPAELVDQLWSRAVQIKVPQ